MKVFEVEITAICTVAVLADSEEEALDIACNEADSGDFQMVNGGPAVEQLADDGDGFDAQGACIRHADIVLTSTARRIGAEKAMELISA